MSLVVKIERVYSANDKFDVDIECICKIKFKNTVKSRDLTFGNKKQVTYQSLDDNDDDERDELLTQTSNDIEYLLGTEINSKDVLQIECFYPGIYHKK
ncbi:unnamed protein product [Brachionus calyciflorus]|uniref:Uncharacterized protein n=1 Tax=Brachionus calyciflorus TaxID=104777 RepID=A0A814AZE1_9BILA|nr:unnamed protein product [Brachionus calyciflorus]